MTKVESQNDSVEELIPTRHSLLTRLKDREDQISWRDFFDTYWKLIYNMAMKAGLNDADAQDVVQETVISVSKSMQNGDYDREKGSFKNWLLQLTRWRILDQLRKRQAGDVYRQHNTHTSTRTATIERVPDPKGLQLEATWNDEWERNLLEAAVQRVKRKADPAQFQIFDLHVIRKWSVIRVSRTLKVNPGKVYLVKHRLGNLVKKEIAYLTAKPI